MNPRHTLPRLACIALLGCAAGSCATTPRDAGIAPRFVSVDEPAAARLARQHPECLTARDEVDQQPALAAGNRGRDRVRSDTALRLPGHCRDIIEQPRLTIRSREQWVPDFSGERD